MAEEMYANIINVLFLDFIDYNDSSTRFCNVHVFPVNK